MTGKSGLGRHVRWVCPSPVSLRKLDSPALGVLFNGLFPFSGQLIKQLIKLATAFIRGPDKQQNIVNCLGILFGFGPASLVDENLLDHKGRRACDFDLDSAPNKLDVIGTKDVHVT